MYHQLNYEYDIKNTALILNKEWRKWLLWRNIPTSPAQKNAFPIRCNLQESRGTISPEDTKIITSIFSQNKNKMSCKMTRYAISYQEDQDGPGSLTWFFEIAPAFFFFFVVFREEFTRTSLCLYSARSLHSLIPCLLTDQNFKNNSEKGHSRNISMRLFQNLTNSFREEFFSLFMFI